MAMCTVLVRWPILRILLYLPYALYAPDDEHFTNTIKTGLSVRQISYLYKLTTYFIENWKYN